MSTPCLISVQKVGDNFQRLNLHVYQHEIRSFSAAAVDEGGNLIDLSYLDGEDLEFVAWDRSNNRVIQEAVTVDVDSSTFNWSITQTDSAKNQKLKYAIWDSTAQAVIVTGHIDILAAVVPA